MSPTLRAGDRVVVDPNAYAGSWPERGDIIVFTVSDAPDILAIKRVIGLPGDVIRQADGNIYVNGVALVEPYAVQDSRTLGPWVVAADRVFVVGDNRPGSNDSRYTMGQIPMSEIVGQVLLEQQPEDRSLPVPPAPVSPKAT